VSGGMISAGVAFSQDHMMLDGTFLQDFFFQLAAAKKYPTTSKFGSC
jgi:hypothetical protein